MLRVAATTFSTSTYVVRNFDMYRALWWQSVPLISLHELTTFFTLTRAVRCDDRERDAKSVYIQI